MGKAADLVEQFQELLQENEREQARVGQLRAEQAELTAEIEALGRRKDDLVSELAKLRADSEADIAGRRDNFELIRGQETARLERESVESSRRAQAATDAEQSARQRASELNEIEELLTALIARLSALRSAIAAWEAYLRVVGEQQQLDWMRIRQGSERNRQEAAGVAHAASDVANENSLVAARHQAALEREAELDSRSKEQDARQTTLDSQAATNEREAARLIEQDKQQKIEAASLAKRRKDNDDKEKSLNALSVELDLKLARLKKGAETA